MRKLRIALPLAVTATLLVATAAFALLFNNGDFESGSWTPGWDAAGQREFLIFDGGYDATGFPNLSAGGSDLSAIVGGPAVAPLSLSDANTGNVLKYPAVGHYSARINSQAAYSGGGNAQNANTLYQTTMVDAGDVDAVDGKVHLRMMYAAVMSFPREDLGATVHTHDQLPMFFLEVKDVTVGAILVHKQSYAGEAGVPWQDGPMMSGNSQWKFLDWTLIDIIAGDGSGSASIVGHTLSIKVVATGCSLGGHPGYVYFDEAGSSHVSVPSVIAFGPASIASGVTITYTYDYFNGSDVTINPTIIITQPTGVTFTSTGLPAGCVLSGGVVTCNFTGVGAGTGGSFQVQGTVTAAAGSTISHGDYTIATTGFPTLGGLPVITAVSAPAPAIGSIVPNFGPIAGGTVVTITGANLLGATSVTFGGTPANLAACTVTATSITCPTPAHAVGPVNVVVTTPGGAATSVGGFTYYAVPTITNGATGGGIAPNSGPIAGGTVVTITGTNLLGATSVTFGGVPADLDLCIVTATSITCPTPAHAVGPVNVVVTTPGGVAISTGGFTFTLPIVPPTDVVISGPTTGTINTAYTFTATVSPVTATTPITYVWQATDQTPVTHTSSLVYTDTVSFTWSTGGAKAITVTARNAGGVVTATHTITIPLSTPRLYLSPADTSPSVTQIFTVEIRVDAGSTPVDTLDAYLDFDPTKLQVVAASGVPVAAIEPNLTVLPNVTYNVVSNTLGQINFSASKLTPPPLGGTFTAATIRFKAMAVVASTGIVFVRSGGRWSDLIYEGEKLASDLSGAVAHITLSMLPGRVTLEKRGLAGNPRWITPLYRMCGTGVVTGGVRLYQPGTSNLAGVYSATTNANGQFTVTLEGAPTGVYDAQVKGANTLSNKRLNVSLPTAGEVNFGTLLVGDSNGDDRVNGGDVSYMIPSFTRCVGDPAYRYCADTNNDGCVNGQDVSALIPNFTKAGPIIVTPTLMSLSAARPEARAPQADASLILSPTNLAVQAGDVFTLNIVFDTGTSQADTVDAYIDFDPAILEVVDAAGAPASTIQANTSVLPNVLYNTVENTLGQIGFSAYKLTPLSGSFTAATLRFRAKAAASASSVNLVRSEGRVSDLYYGESIEPTLGNASVIVGAPTAVTLQDLSASAHGNSNGLMSFAALFALLGLGAARFTRRVKGKAQP